MDSLEIRKVSDEVDLKRLRRFMLLQHQFYPGHGEWVDGKAIPRIESGQAEGLLVIQDGIVVGDAVYQKVSGASAIELKNLRIDPDYRTAPSDIAYSDKSKSRGQTWRGWHLET